jgi:hypothetical protein
MTEVLITKTNEMMDGMRKLRWKTWSEIKQNKAVILHIKQRPDGWAKLIESCCKLDPTLSEDVLMFAVRTAETFDICMSYFPKSSSALNWSTTPQSKKLQSQVLKYAAKLAETSSHYLVIAERLPNKEKEETALSKAAALAKTTKSIDLHLEVFHGVIKSHLKYDKMAEIGGNAIINAMSLSKPFDDIDKVLTTIDIAKIPNDFAYFLRGDLRIIGINAAVTKTETPFINKENIAEAIKVNDSKTIALAINMMNLTREIQKLRKSTENLSDDNQLKIFAKKISQIQ